MSLFSTFVCAGALFYILPDFLAPGLFYHHLCKLSVEVTGI